MKDPNEIIGIAELKFLKKCQGCKKLKNFNSSF